MPKHYMKQFHIDFNPDAQQLAEDEGYEYWYELWDDMGNWQLNPDLPSLRPWLLVDPYDGTGTRVRFERNPYYWKVDSDGRQLPYADGWEFDLLEDAEVVLLRALAGEIDLLVRHINTVENRPVLYDSKEDGNYRFKDREPTSTNEVSINFNMTYDDDDVLREMFRDVQFKAALSHALNREEINDIIMAGMSEPWQAAPQRDAPFFHERLATQYLEYDPELAEQKLQDAGYERDEDGYLLRPDGERLSFQITAAADDIDRLSVLEVVIQQWQDFGIDVAIDSVDRSLFHERVNNNQHQVAIFGGGPGYDAILDPRAYFPYDESSLFAQRWSAWYNPGGSLADVEPEEPPEDVKRQMELYDEILSTSPDRHNELMYEILEIAADRFFRMGTVSRPPEYGIVHNRLRNVPDSLPGSWTFPDPATGRPEQFWIDE